ncbi:MAG: uroporphyrinogen decarboxylase family protein [Planctomycetota bacterium]
MTRREKLLSWMAEGDPDRMPLLFWVGGDLPNVWYGREGNYGYEEQIRAARELGAEVWFCVHGPSIFHGVNDYAKDIRMSSEEEKLPSGGTRTVRRFETPEGTLTDIREKTFDEPLRIVRNFVMGAHDVPAYQALVRGSARGILENRERVLADLVRETGSNIAATHDEGPAMMWLFIPMVELTCSQFFKQEEGLYFIHDHRETLEELMDLHMQATMLWIEAGAQAGVDIFGYSINGYEIYSPTLYRNIVVPQAKAINQRIRDAAKLSWWHCCGRYQRMVQEGIWADISPDVMESYSPPPAGDITDLRRIRNATKVRASRGAMYVGYLWEDGPQEIRRRTKEIIEAMRGHRHMLGGTDDMLPGTPRENLVAMRDAVEEQGMAFE